MAQEAYANAYTMRLIDEVISGESTSDPTSRRATVRSPAPSFLRPPSPPSSPQHAIAESVTHATAAPMLALAPSSAPGTRSTVLEPYSNPTSCPNSKATHADSPAMRYLW